MSIIALASNTLSSPASAGQIEYDGNFYATDSNSARGQLERITRGTAVSASGTSVDFTGIPAWVKKITVMYNGISTNGTSQTQIQIGAGSIQTSGYTASAGTVTSTTGFIANNGMTAAEALYGILIITNITGNTWVYSSMVRRQANADLISSGVVSLSGTLDRLRLTTLNGTDTFDAGTINVMWEG